MLRRITVIGELMPKKTSEKGERVGTRYVVDTSSIINGNVTQLINEGKIEGEIILPEFVISELENQANKGKDIGFDGLDELKALRVLCKEKGIALSESGRRPTLEEITLAKSGRIDSLIKDIAKENKATLITADIVQAKSAEAIGLDVIFFKREEIKTPGIETLFTKDTLSVHLKEGTTPKAKIGRPGNWKLTEIGTEILSKEVLEQFAKEIQEIVRVSDESFIEMSDYGATVVQHGKFRIAITRSPFSKGMEITAVRPVVKVDLEHYKLSQKLKDRLDTKAEGILVAGPPGHGKSTLAAAMAEFYQKKGKIVKTMEQPRDLQVGPEITQYAPLNKSMEKTADILLLVRPDYTVYDEVRKTQDFKIFADMRLAGVGMVGIVHATKAIDAVHRFLDRVELGLIPQVVDTIIYVKEGLINQVYTLNLKVKVPTGMVEADLSRPVIEVLDFETGKLEYEVYTYGEQTVVIPVEGNTESQGLNKLAEERLREILRKHIPDPVVEVISADRAIIRVKDEDIAFVIGKGGSHIQELEKLTGIHLTVEPIVETLKKEIEVSVDEQSGNLMINVDPQYIGKNVDVYKGTDFLFTATIGKKSHIKTKKKSELGDAILKAVKLNELRVLVG